MKPLLISLPQACSLINITPQTGFKWLKKGKLPFKTVLMDGQLVIRLTDVELYVDQLFESATNDANHNVLALRIVGKEFSVPGKPGRPLLRFNL
jgi:hypothetical protein